MRDIFYLSCMIKTYLTHRILYSFENNGATQTIHVNRRALQTSNAMKPTLEISINSLIGDGSLMENSFSCPKRLHFLQS